MSANDRQVGGTHYRTKPLGVQHWDYCSACEVQYLEGLASKYVSRWRKKNGVVDLEKAVHCLEKRIEDYHNDVGAKKGVNIREALFNRFIADNDIWYNERQILDLIFHWKNTKQLEYAIGQIQFIIKTFSVEEGEATSAYVNQDR